MSPFIQLHYCKVRAEDLNTSSQQGSAWFAGGRPSGQTLVLLSAQIPETFSALAMMCLHYNRVLQFRIACPASFPVHRTDPAAQGTSKGATYCSLRAALGCSPGPHSPSRPRSADHRLALPLLGNLPRPVTTLSNCRREDDDVRVSTLFPGSALSHGAPNRVT